MTERRRMVRTCIGCRNEFEKNDVIRIVAGPDGPVIDYRAKLPGRAAYVCPNRACIEQALSKDRLARALRVKSAPVEPEAFLGSLIAAVRGRMASLLAMAAKAGKLASGYSAVEDALCKGRAALLLFAEDVAAGTREKILDIPEARDMRHAVFLAKDELGPLVGRESAGVLGITEKGFADAFWRETTRLKGLLNTHS